MITNNVFSTNLVYSSKSIGSYVFSCITSIAYDAATTANILKLLWKMTIIKLYGIETANWCTNCTSSLNSSSFPVSVYRVYIEKECAQPEEKEAAVVLVNINKY